MPTPKRQPAWAKAPLIAVVISEVQAIEKLGTPFAAGCLIANALKREATHLFGARAVQARVPELAQVVLDESDPHAVPEEIVEAVLRGCEAYVDDVEDLFRVQEDGDVQMRNMARAVLREIGIRFAPAPPCTLPRLLWPDLEALRVTTKAGLVGRLTKLLAQRSFEEAAQLLASLGDEFARYADELATTQSTQSILEDALSMDWTGPAPKAVIELDAPNAISYSPNQRFKLGETCSHPKFGLGRVDEVTDALVVLRFADDSTKKLVHGRV